MQNVMENAITAAIVVRRCACDILIIVQNQLGEENAKMKWKRRDEKRCFIVSGRILWEWRKKINKTLLGLFSLGAIFIFPTLRIFMFPNLFEYVN